MSAINKIAPPPAMQVWPGTEPDASERLEKIGFKKICSAVGAPTPPFIVLADDGPSANLRDPTVKQAIVDKYCGMVVNMKSRKPGLIKSIHGGGGKVCVPQAAG